jgi:hypothetical protein
VADTDAAVVPLTIKEMKQVAELRQFDSTDYYWEEMSTGDYEWAMGNFMHDVEAGVDQAIEDATSREDAEQLARDFLASLGLDQLVHINTPATGPNDNIIVTGHTHHPTLLDPLLLTVASLDFGFVDLSAAYQDLDESAITVAIEDGLTSRLRLKHSNTSSRTQRICSIHFPPTAYSPSRTAVKSP